MLVSCASGNYQMRLKMLNQMRRFLQDQSGTAAIEYGLITAGISVAIISSVNKIGAKLVVVFTTLMHAL
jgi:pilus assembly protein Flp/PilA